MNPTDLGYSLKNIPITSKYNYLKQLTEKVENFIKRIRWKAYFFDKSDCDAGDNNNNDECNPGFGFKTNLTPPQHDLLINFEK